MNEVGANVAVMYEVIGIKNRGHAAHITTYIGPAAGPDADKY